MGTIKKEFELLGLISLGVHVNLEVEKWDKLACNQKILFQCLLVKQST